MVYDFKEMQRDYALCYSDKSRIMFVEKYFSTFNAMKGKKTQFHCFPRQRAFLKALAENNNVIAIKPRQCGITTLSSAWAAAECAFAPKDAPQTILCIANKLDQANEIIIKVRDFLEQVPRWYWGSDYFSTDPNSEKNLKSIFVKDAKSELKLFNGCRIIARASGPNAARGISAVGTLILDEAAFIEDGISVYTTAAATMASNPNSKTVIVSTPNGMDALYYNIYRQALAHENNFTAVQFRWYQDPRFNKYLVWKKKNEDTGEWEYDQDPIVDSEGSVKYDEARWAKLEHDGWKPDSPWYQDMCKSFNNDEMKIAQELDVSFMGSADNVVGPKYIQQQETLNVREPLEDFVDPLVPDTWFWKKPIDGHRYICACLPEGEMIMTQRGLVNVEGVKDDDLLVTKEGELTKIKRRMIKEVMDEEIIDIKPHNFIDSIKFTHNHPIWSSIDSKYKDISRRKTVNGKQVRISRKHFWKHNFDFNDASKISVGSWLEVPNYYRNNILSNDEILDTWNKKYKNENFECPLFEKDFWWYCGMWLAEGCYREKNNYIQTTHNINERGVIDKIAAFLNESIKLNCSILERKMCNACDVVFYSNIIKKFLSENFGHYADGKFVAEWIKRIPEEYKLSLVKGYFDGDGHTSYDGTQRATSISKKLLCDIQDILLSCGITSTVKLKRKTFSRVENGKIINRKDSYGIQLGKDSTKIFYKKINSEKYDSIRPTKQGLYFSEDLSYFYVKVERVTKTISSCIVYNFETESDSHTFCCRGIATHNCDPSRGTSFDKTGIEIIDMDGRDENGMPIIEQVAEYRGKKLGDDIGALCYQYATLYNDAFIVVDNTGGIGDAAIITLLQMGYKNLYYEDMNQKTYLIQRSTKNYDGYTDKLPGFHFQGNRYPVLSNLAGMIRNNEIKIRSARVINELNTWIFKGETGRIDHMEGANDDLLCSLAMGLFVMQYTVNRIQNTQNKDKAILNAYMRGNGIAMSKPKIVNGEVITPKGGLPFYSGKKIAKKYEHINGTHLWLFGHQR